MNKVIILEGPDGAGKTFLAERLMTFGWDMKHEGPPEGDPFQGYVGKLLKYLKAKRPVVLDRFHLGEYIYGPVKRDTNYMTATGLRIFSRICRAYNVAQVICLPPWTDVRDAWERKDGNDYLTRTGELCEVYYRYKGLTKSSRYLHYDWTLGSDSWTAEKLADWAGFNQVPLPMGTIGHPAAKFLVVGEVSNTAYDLPFVDQHNSSKYLNYALRQAGFSETELALTNAWQLRANRTQKKRSLKEVFSHLPGFRMAIALGQEAAKACQEADLPFVKIHHPSQHRRFHHQKKDHYIETLRSIHASTL